MRKISKDHVNLETPFSFVTLDRSYFLSSFICGRGVWVCGSGEGTPLFSQELYKEAFPIWWTCAD